MQIKKTMLTESVTLEELRKFIREGRAAEVLTAGDQIYIDFDGAAVPYDVIGIDVDKPAAEELKHTVTIQAHELTGRYIKRHNKKSLRYCNIIGAKL